MSPCIISLHTYGSLNLWHEAAGVLHSCTDQHRDHIHIHANNFRPDGYQPHKKARNALNVQDQDTGTVQVAIACFAGNLWQDATRGCGRDADSQSATIAGYSTTNLQPVKHTDLSDVLTQLT